VRYGLDKFVDTAAELQHQTFNVIQIDEPTTFEEAFDSEHAISTVERSCGIRVCIVDGK